MIEIGTDLYKRLERYYNWAYWYCKCDSEKASKMTSDYLTRIEKGYRKNDKL